MGKLYAPAVYVMTHVPTGHFYVGSSRSLGHRLNSHKSQLTKGIHSSHKLQEVFTTWDDIHVEFRETSTKEEALELEQNVLKLVTGIELCCNAYTTVTDSSPGFKKKKKNYRNRNPIAMQYANRRKKVMVDGIEYHSVKAAAEAHGIPPSTAADYVRAGTGRGMTWEFL